MIGSGYIVAINKDEDASIFDVADVGIVGDVTKVLPVMIEEMRREKQNKAERITVRIYRKCHEVNENTLRVN